MVRKCAREKSSEETAKLLQDKAAEYGMPGNCTELAVPRVEDLVWDQLDMQTRTRDAALQGLQQCLLRGLTAVAQAMDAIMAKVEKIISHTYEIIWLKSNYKWSLCSIFMWCVSYIVQ